LTVTSWSGLIIIGFVNPEIHDSGTKCAKPETETPSEMAGELLKKAL
jgi:hypothetical protein